MKPDPDLDLPFDRALRRLRRDRAAASGDGADYLHRRAADELIDRLDLVVSVGLLDSVNDLPGALSLVRRAL